MSELLVEVVEIAERAAEEEVLADVAEGPLDLALRFRPIGPAGARLKTVMTGEVDEGAVVDDELVGVLADDRGLHPVVEDRARRAADRVEGGDVAAQDALQILVEDEPRPDQARVAEHHREQPGDAFDARLVGELDLKPGEVDLGLLAWRSLEARFKSGAAGRTNVAHAVAHDAVATRKAALLDLPEQTPDGQCGIGRQALAQIRFEAIDEARRRRALLVGRRFQPFGYVGPHGLSVDADLPGDGADRQALAMQIQDHDELPKFDHRVLPPAKRGSLGDSARSPTIPGMPGMVGSHENWGNFKCHKWGELLRHSHQAPSRAIARQLAAGLRADYANVLPSALACFEDDFEASIAHLRLRSRTVASQGRRTSSNGCSSRNGDG